MSQMMALRGARSPPPLYTCHGMFIRAWLQPVGYYLRRVPRCSDMGPSTHAVDLSGDGLTTVMTSQFVPFEAMC